MSIETRSRPTTLFASLLPLLLLLILELNQSVDALLQQRVLETRVFGRRHPVPLHRRIGHSSSSSRWLSSTSSTEETNEGIDLTDKMIYQCALYQLSPGSSVDIPNAMTIEQRVRFQPDPDRPGGYLVPYGPRTLILREACDLEEGAIGKELFRLHVREPTPTHNGIGTTMDSTIATILFLASNPQLVQGNVLELSCQLGLSGLLGSIAAALTSGETTTTTTTSSTDNTMEILTVPQHVASAPLPSKLERLTLTDETDEHMNIVLANVKAADVDMSKIMWKKLDWSHVVARGDLPLATRPPQQRRRTSDEPEFYSTILAADIDYVFPNSKALAKTVAHQLAPIPDDVSKPTPRFVHVCPDDPTRDDIPYLHRFLERGYRMTVSTGYLKLQKLLFKYQIIPRNAPEDETLDNEPLELQQEQDLPYQSLVAQHHPDYTGVGEYFFPMETGEFDGSNKRAFLEPESGGGMPW